MKDKPKEGKEFKQNLIQITARSDSQKCQKTE